MPMKQVLRVLIFKILVFIAEHRRRRFVAKLKNIKSTQLELLKQITLFYSKTEYGESISINNAHTYDDFKKLPMRDYDELSHIFEAEKQNFSKRILPIRPKIWELTSGSSGNRKSIPYSKEQLKSFIDTILISFADLIKYGPKFKTSKIFFSLSPKSSKADAHTFSNDSEYLPLPIRALFSKYLINPKSLERIKDEDDYRLILALNLLQENDLETIFIWSPSYLTVMLDFIQKNRIKILAIAIANEYIVDNIKFKFKFNKKTIELLKYTIDFDKLWPYLKLISCWMDGSSSHFVAQIKAIFPNIVMQAKGLIATEAIFTFPLESHNSKVPLITHNFYEFIDTNARVFPLWNLEVGKAYEIVISNRSGLIRYRIGDIIRVDSIQDDIPNIVFTSRKNVVDITGEKLNETLIKEIFEKITIKDDISFLYPVVENGTVYYNCLSNSKSEDLNEKLEYELSKILHYNESRRNGQLSPSRVEYCPNIINRYNRYYLDKGLIMGDIKMSYLLTEFQ